MVLIGELEDRLERCGVVIVIGHKEAPLLCAEGLVGVQHRGQAYAGIAFEDNNKLIAIKGRGQVADVLTIDKLIRYKDVYKANGQTRYPTYGDVTEEDAQPLIANNLIIAGQKYDVSVTHNGQIINYGILKNNIQKKINKKEILNYSFKSSTDSEILFPLLQNLKANTLEEAVVSALKQLKGAYCFGLHFLNKKTKEEIVVAARDPNGIRPFVLGKKKGAYIIASETLALYYMDAEFIRYIDPGEALFFTKDKKTKSIQIAPIDYTPCIFEWLYFSHMASSVMLPPMEWREKSKNLGKEAPPLSYNTIRENMSKIVYEEIMKQVPNYKPDFINPLLLSGGPFANGLSRISGWPIRYALAMNVYRKKGEAGRTFIMHGIKTIKEAIKQKFAPVLDVIFGSHICNVDDSLVDGNTSTVTIDILRKYGAKIVDWVIYSPLLVNFCNLGVDIKRQELIAQKAIGLLGYDLDKYNLRTEVRIAVRDKVAELIGADNLVVPSLESLLSVMPQGINYCTHCLGGKHPITKN